MHTGKQAAVLEPDLLRLNPALAMLYLWTLVMVPWPEDQDRVAWADSGFSSRS